MRALCWQGVRKVSVEDVPDPAILNPRDAIVRITATAICGSDLHLYDGYIPTMERGDILGHEFMGEVVEIGPGVRNLAIGDRVVVPFTISCGNCFFCSRGLWSACDNSNPNAWMQEKAYGHATAGIFGYSHMLGGYAGGQAQFARVPFADAGPIKIPAGIPDEQVLFLSDILPTGYQAAEQCGLQADDTVAVWGCGPVGQMAIRSCFLLGAQRVIAIDNLPDRLRLAASASGADTINSDDGDVYEQLMDATGGLGPDACIDAVGLEAHGHTPDAIYDRVKVATFLATDRIHVLRQAIRACRKAGVLSVPGVYGGLADKFPIGAWFGKGLTMRGGQTHVQRHLGPLLERILSGQIDPSFIITHRVGLDDGPEAYAAFARREAVKVVIDPWRGRDESAGHAAAGIGTEQAAR